MSTTRSILVSLEASGSGKRIRLKAGTNAELHGDAQRLYVKSGEKASDADRIVFEADGGDIDEFSLFFPNEAVIKNPTGGWATKALHPVNGGDFFNSKVDVSGKHKVKLKINANASEKRSYEYYVTATDKDGQVYTKDPDVYIDC